MHTRPKLDKFFKEYSEEDNLEIALEMIAEKAECAKEALESDDEDEFLFYLLEAHKMIESLLTEINVQPEQIRQKYPRGIKSKRYESYERRGYSNPNEGNQFENPNEPRPSENTVETNPRSSGSSRRSSYRQSSSYRGR